MFGKRWIGLLVMVLIFVAVISAFGSAGQRTAWQQGYLAGRLSAGGEAGDAALAPYLYGPGAFGPHYGGFPFGWLFLLGLLAFAFAMTRCSRLRERIRDETPGNPWERAWRHHAHRHGWPHRGEPEAGGEGSGQGDVRV